MWLVRITRLNFHFGGGGLIAHLSFPPYRLLCRWAYFWYFALAGGGFFLCVFSFLILLTLGACIFWLSIFAMFIRIDGQSQFQFTCTLRFSIKLNKEIAIKR